MSVFRSRLSLPSVTLICCLIISADVIGRLGLEGGKVNDIPGEPPLFDAFGEEGLDHPPFPAPDAILLDGDRFSIFSPSARFTLLVGVVTTPFTFDPDPDPLPSPPLLLLLLLSWWLE